VVKQTKKGDEGTDELKRWTFLKRKNTMKTEEKGKKKNE
jgi:hypothetical protein